MSKHFAIVCAVIKKDFLSLLPLMLLAVSVQVLDVVVPKLDVLPQVAPYVPFVWFAATTLVIFSVFQLDAPASLVDDWLCRPVPKRALFLGKVLLLLSVLYLPRVVAMLGVNLALGYTPGESLQEAVLLQLNYHLIAFPLILVTAVVTATTIQGLGALIALFVLLFVIPSPFLPARGPLEPGVGDAISSNGMLWMGLAPAKLIALALMSLSFWIVYRHRNILVGRVMLVASAIVSVLTVFIPLALPWATVYALQRAVTGSDSDVVQPLANRLRLHHADACFPATNVGALSDDTGYAAIRQSVGISEWSEEFLQKAGVDDVTFITRVQAHGIPRDLRVRLAYAQASLVDAVSGKRIRLRPGEEVPSGHMFSHQWLLPRKELDELLRGAPSLELTYSMSVLRPVSHELPADGARRALAGVGYCGAVQEPLTNRIVVDCFNGAERPSLISAELLDIPASGVDSGIPDYAPAIVQAPSSARFELHVGPASLLESPIVEVAGWEPAGFVDASVTSPGILGASVTECPLPSSTSLPGTQLTSWKDDSPHTAFYFTVDDGVQLEVLDWGGTGTPLLLIHGLGATAHTWDDIAPLLVRNHRVLALTRRGIGGSSRPDSAYDSATLARDAVRVLAALNIDRAVMVGSSIGGQELSWLGAEYPERVAALVYLDAAFDYATQQDHDFESVDSLLPPRPPMAPSDLRSYTTLQQWMAATDTDPIPEGEMLALYNVTHRFLAGSPSIDRLRLEAIEAAVRRPRYDAIRAPVLALYAIPDGPEYFMKPWYDRDDPALLPLLAEMSDRVIELKRAAIEVFADNVPDAEIREMLGAAHGMHLSHREEVAAEIERFVATRVQPIDRP